MLIDSNTAQTNALIDIANKLAVAARTAPKARGWDTIHTLVITGEDVLTVADEMDRISNEHNLPGLYGRDANNIRKCTAMVIIGAEHMHRGLKICQYCGFENCAKCKQAGSPCVYDSVDLGIALGSAAALAADFRVDNRILYTAGMAVLNMGLMHENVKMAFAIPLSALGKNPFFDRK